MQLKYKIFFLLFFTSSALFAQVSEQVILQEADEAFQAGDYYSAALSYARLLNDVSKAPIDISYKYAESLRQYNAYTEAVHWYKYVADMDSSNQYPDATFWLALMLKQTGNYDLAGSYLNTYITKNSNAIFLEKAKLEIESCKSAKWITQDTLPVTIEHLDSNINTPYSEFGAVQLSDTALYFSSLRMIVADEYGSILPGVFVSKIFRSKMSVAGLSTANEFTAIINDPKTNNGNLSFSPEHTKIFFSRCQTLKSKLSCELWASEIIKNKWQKPERLTRKINLPGTTNTQPSYVDFGDFQVLYFASDRPNGYGAMDIWYSIIKQGKYSDPINLGSNINTIGDEITPFYHLEDSSLYFSSNTQPGIGGFDIFSSKGGLNQWTRPKNMGVPINSGANDLYYTVNEIDNDGYLTSNRTGSYYIKGETCCNDIYSFEWKSEPIVETKVHDTIRIDTSNIVQFMKNILPLTLYFHNDEPNPGTTKTTTNKNYKNTLANYFALKDIYSNEYSKGLDSRDSIAAVQDIADFFNEYVKKGFTDLELFAKWLLIDLEQGNSAKIAIKGYTSPLHTAQYNMKLAMRRISSLKNFIYDYRNGIFKPYLDNTAQNGSTLELIDAPFGKTEANALVSDNPNDRRNSVYSRAAALERRIQIVMYESSKTKTKTTNDSLAKLVIPTDLLNFGRISKGESKTIVLQFKNDGIKRLVIDSIQAINPLVNISHEKTNIPNGGVGYITFEVKHKPSDQPIDTEVWIFSNAINSKVKIQVKGVFSE